MEFLMTIDRQGVNAIVLGVCPNEFDPNNPRREVEGGDQPVVPPEDREANTLAVQRNRFGKCCQNIVHPCPGSAGDKVVPRLKRGLCLSVCQPKNSQRGLLDHAHGEIPAFGQAVRRSGGIEAARGLYDAPPVWAAVTPPLPPSRCLPGCRASCWSRRPIVRGSLLRSRSRCPCGRGGTAWRSRGLGPNVGCRS